MSQVRQIVREAITDLIDEGFITQEDLRKWFGKGGQGGAGGGGWDNGGSYTLNAVQNDLTKKIKFQFVL